MSVPGSSSETIPQLGILGGFDYADRGVEPQSDDVSGGGPNYGAVSNFSVPFQEQTQWCWAALTLGLIDLAFPASGWAQSSVAGEFVPGGSCSGAQGGVVPCNTPRNLHEVLGHFNLLHHWQAGDAENLIQGEIGSQRPLCVRIGWSGGGGHFVAVSAWRWTPTGQMYVHVEDPYFGPQDLPVGELRLSYQGSGTWTHSYFVNGVQRVSSLAATGGSLGM